MRVQNKVLGVKIAKINRKKILILSWKSILCVLIEVILTTSLNIPLFFGRSKTSQNPANARRLNNVDSTLIQRQDVKDVESTLFQRCVPAGKYPHLPRPGAMNNPQWLELPMSRTYSHGATDIRAIEVRLYEASYCSKQRKCWHEARICRWYLDAS